MSTARTELASGSGNMSTALFGDHDPADGVGFSQTYSLPNEVGLNDEVFNTYNHAKLCFFTHSLMLYDLIPGSDAGLGRTWQ